MKTFLRRFGALMLGILCGFDRVRFRGSKRQLCYTNGIMGFLQSRNVPLCDFKSFAQSITEALFQGSPGESAAILAQMQEVADYREANQPIKERTGGSTFKNPPGNSAWKLIDAAGCRGLRVGGAKVSEMHCNFLINDRNASGEDVERLGETVRARVREASGVTLSWEIIRLGVPKAGHPTGEALVEAFAQ